MSDVDSGRIAAKILGEITTKKFISAVELGLRPGL
jgi:hypothetical protein